jgi:hypothetical protein
MLARAERSSLTLILPSLPLLTISSSSLACLPMGKQAKEEKEQSCEEREQLAEQEKQARMSERERAWVDKNGHEVRKVTYCLSTANIPNCCAFCQCVKCIAV